MKNIQLNVSLNFPQLIDAIKHLSPMEKLQVNDALWEEDMDVPSTHQTLVLERMMQAKQNPSRLLDWDEASKTLNA